jgi:hypothetical protein
MFGEFISTHITIIFVVLMFLFGGGFVISLLVTYSKSGSYTPPTTVQKLTSEFQVGVQYEKGETDSDGKDLSYKVQGWDYFNKKKIVSIPYPNRSYVNGDVLQYLHDEGQTEDVVIV